MTAIEYCFMLSLVFLAVLIAVQHLGSMLRGAFEHSNGRMEQVGVGVNTN